MLMLVPRRSDRRWNRSHKTEPDDVIRPKLELGQYTSGDVIVDQSKDVTRDRITWAGNDVTPWKPMLSDVPSDVATPQSRDTPGNKSMTSSSSRRTDSGIATRRHHRSRLRYRFHSNRTHPVPVPLFGEADDDASSSSSASRDGQQPTDAHDAESSSQPTSDSAYSDLDEQPTFSAVD